MPAPWQPLVQLRRASTGSHPKTVEQKEAGGEFCTPASPLQTGCLSAANTIAAVIGRGTRLFAALAAIALCAGALSACGGSDSNSSSSSTSSTGSEKNGGPGGEGTSGKGQGGGGEQQGSKAGGEPHESAPISPLRVSGGGSGQFRVKGGDNSVQDFGEESSEGELEEAAATLHDFYVARAEEDWRAACARLAKTVVEQLEQLGSRSKSGDESCPAVLASLTPSLPPAVQRESTAVDAGSLRVEGERGFLIYTGAEQTIYAINMAHEGGQWKVGSLAPVALR